MNAEGLMENSGGRGLPEKLPAGERVLWQGSPDWKALLTRAFRAKYVAVYFAAVIAWCVFRWLQAGMPVESVAISAARLVGLSLVPFVVIALYCWGVARSTIYTITSRRVVMSFGLVVPMTVNLPFSRIASAGLKHHAGGSGDVPLQLMPTERMAYFMVWPHARPWRMARAEPMLRCIPRGDDAAAVLARALSAHAALSQAFPSAPLRARIDAAPGQGQTAQAA